MFSLTNPSNIVKMPAINIPQVYQSNPCLILTIPFREKANVAAQSVLSVFKQDNRYISMIIVMERQIDQFLPLIPI